MYCLLANAISGVKLVKMGLLVKNGDEKVSVFF